MKQLINRFFQLESQGATLEREITGGITTFLAMSYIIFVQPGVLSQAGMDFRAVLAATYQLAQHNNLDFNLTYIDGAIPQTSLTGFDTDYMRALYELGYEKARRGNFWAHQPPRPEDSFLASR